MCTTCGCSDTNGVTITDPATGEKQVATQAEHDHAHAHAVAHEHGHAIEDAGGDQHNHDPRAYRPVHKHGRKFLHGHDTAMTTPTRTAMSMSRRYSTWASGPRW